MSMRTAESAAAEDVPPRAFRRLVGNAGLPGLPADVSVVTESDLAPLPQAAQRYLRPLTAWDTYLDGRRTMRGQVLGLVPVVDGLGPQFDTSELVTWLNDAVLMAPSMLLAPEITWSAGPDADSFEVAVTDGGRTVSARVVLDHPGAPCEFWTDDRYADLPGGSVRARWRTPVKGWSTVGGRPQMTGARAVWELVGDPFDYAEFALISVILNVPPR